MLRDRLRALAEYALRISTQMYVAIGVLVSLTVAAIVVSWLSFNSIEGTQDRVNTESLPRIVSAFRITELSSQLVAAAPRLTVAATPAELNAVSAEIVATQEDFRGELQRLEQQDIDAGLFVAIRSNSRQLESNIAQIEVEMPTSFALDVEIEALRVQLAEISRKLDQILLPALDEQLFYLMTGYRQIGEPPVPRERHFTEAEIIRYRHLLALQADTAIATQLLSSAFGVSNAALLEPLQESFESVTDRIEISAGAIGLIAQRAYLVSVLADLLELGAGDESGFSLVSQQLALAERQRGLLTQNREQAAELAAGVQELISTAQADADEATAASTDAIGTSRILLLVIAGISVVVGLSIILGFVSRVLLRRLNQLSNRMRRMADGDLEEEVVISGRDEVSEMAHALEVFRRHALEVQRLNLVEKLAEELGDKNSELEQVLDELHKAQDQIVMREKLAALGEVTAGVAHEIRNPLNFVKNFSEVSAELVEELEEVLEEAEGTLSDEQRGLISDIAADLTENLERIGSHGARANTIVHDMLMMSRETGEWRLADLNSLIEEHAKLAFHSARAVDPDFQLNLEFDLDPEVGELEVLPQDLGRVFINMVGNSCHATDEKRKRLVEAGEASSYMPTVRTTSARTADGVEIRIHDNGDGIPPEVVDKIFNPFFTTKPTDQGTGLGLAITNDIVREHGGTIGVDTAPGEFTEMTISLPATRAEVPAEATAADPDGDAPGEE
ncbi:MAG: HAMP domain-containing protein [Acidimicrobiia bacterium]|nr:HAMP domain-containing protein [Acidimicrobiia bacterium]